MRSYLLYVLTSCCFFNARAQQTPPYLDPAQPIEARISDLLPRLTLQEKVLQLSDSWGSKGISRLKVPAMLKTEGLHGQSYSTGATIYPQPIAMASSFDTVLLHNIGKATAVESKAAGLRVSWSPVLDVARDVRWGRVEETYGEDPFLVSRMGVAWINGFQNEGMIAVPKHFAGHGEPLGGRDSHDVGLSDRTMRNVHLVPFRAAIKEAHAGGVMAAYSTWDGVPDNGSRELLQKILREEWGFDGIVVSDCSAPENFLRKQSVVPNLDEAARMAILAGVDIECGSVNAFTLAGAIKRGVLKESDLDVNLRRVFRAKYRLGLFDGPAPDKMIWDKLPAYDVPAHRALARQAAIEGSVLLKNDHGFLPLRKDLAVLAVIGPNADMAQTGDYSAKAASGQLVTVLQGIKSHISVTTKVLYERGCSVESMDSSGFDKAVAAASKADAVVLVVGDYSNNDPAIENKEKTTTGENVDGATLEIPGVQRQLIRRIVATGKPVVLVLVNGKPFTLSWEALHLAAIVETWYPGEEGGNATADILFGDANPSGRLPVSFPRHVGQLPLRYDYLPSGRNYNYYDMPFSPLYRFGYGLSYTSFAYSNLTTAVNPDGSVLVSVDVENTGGRAGDEVVQLYLTDVLTSVITPVINLKGFQRVHLGKGEKKKVSFLLWPYQLSLLNAAMERVVEPGQFRVHVGGVSPEPPPGNTEHKLKIGFKDPAVGVSGAFDITTAYTASFLPRLEAPASTKAGVAFPVTVTVRNDGNLTDVADIKVYGETLLDDYRSEIDAGESVRHTFDVTLYKRGRQNITVIVGKMLISRPVDVTQLSAGEGGVRNGQDSGQRVVVPVGGGLALQDTLLYLDFDGGRAKDRVSGVSLNMQGRIVNGLHLDLYRKSFSLSTWVKVDRYDNGQAMFFGGSAPMGADVDSSGTVLAAGIQNERMLLSFLGRDVKGTTRVATGKWVHLAYTYDAENRKGALYLNGRLDGLADQKAYVGQLEMIGGAPRFGHGKFVMGDVLVMGDCLSPLAIKKLYEKGFDGLRPAKGSPTSGSKHSPSSMFPSYKGLVMAGYQGWFNAPGDGAGRGWNHYVAHGEFGPGNCKFDLWPAMEEYKKTYETPFVLPDGKPARLFSSYDASTVDLHFKWMQQYGIDGVFVQRFVSNIKSPVSLRHNNAVLRNALASAKKYRRAIAVMYDLSGMKPDDYETVINDWKNLVDSLGLTTGGRNQPYLYHRGKPLVTLWGVGFNDHRAYTTKDVEKIVDFLKNDPLYGGCSIMLGVPTYWRDFGSDTEKDPALTALIKKADIVQPWFVGRYNDSTYDRFKAHIKGDVDWCRANGLDYAPVVFPGFSWHNMYNHSPYNQIPRNKGAFFWKQINGAIESGAEMLYVAMFDEIDEGTAIFKVSKHPPAGFVAIDKEIPEDYYLQLAGRAGKMLKKEIPIGGKLPAARTGSGDDRSNGLKNDRRRTEYTGVFAPSPMFVHEKEKPYRDDICLNGLWQFEPLSLPAGFKEGVDPAPALGAMDLAGWDKVPIRIPSPWNVNSFADKNGQGGDFRCYPSYPSSWDGCKMGWLRKTFVLPADWKGRRIQLDFEAVAGDVQVIVNGKTVGTHFGIFLPFALDITDAVHPGGENEICVGVRKASLFDIRGNYGRRIYQAGSFWGQHIAGIWQDVFVVALPDVHVTNVFVQPRVDADTLAAEVALVNDRDVEAKVTVGADAGMVSLAEKEVRVPAHGAARLVLAEAVKGRLKFWSTDTPNLYDLVVRVKGNGGVVDAKTTRFGWRQVSLRGNQVLLNGKPIVMRGDSWHFLGIPQMTRRYAEAWYGAMRDAGLNAVRLHAQPYPSFYLDVADEMGILVLDESAMWASDGGPKLDDPRYWRDSKRHLTGLILRDRNHPSVFGWSVSNEIMPVVRNVFHNPPGMADTLLKYDEEWTAICRKLDPTRSWISADGEDDGQGRFPVYVVHYGGTDAMNRAQKNGKPWGVGEAGNAYYGTPEQIAQTNGDRAYASFEGRMEGVAASSYRSLVAQQERGAVYQSVFNLVWYGLRPLPLGLWDTTRPPTLEDGVFFTHFKEGEPGVQPERLGPYCTTLNPGYDPALPVYRTWPLFDAIRDAATGGDGRRWLGDTAAGGLKVDSRTGELARAGKVLFVDGVRGLREIGKVTSEGGTVVVWNVRPEMVAELNKLLPTRLELYERKVSSLLPVGHDPLMAGITAADLYFSEMRPPEIVDYTLGGPLVERGRVLVEACGTDWLQWNKQPEYAKTAMVVRSEQEAKAPGAVMIEVPMGAGRVIVSTLPTAPRVGKAVKAVRMLLGNLGVALRDSGVGGKPILTNGELSLQGANEFWVLSPRSLDDLLSEPNIPVVNLEVSGNGEVLLNDVLVVKGKGVARALRLRQGWNHFVVKGNVSGKFMCNQPDFLKQLDSAFDRP